MKSNRRKSSRKKIKFGPAKFLLLLFILSATLSWTSAKYITQIEGAPTDSARGAKWYINEGWSDFALFANENYFQFSNDHFVYGSIDTGLMGAVYNYVYANIRTVESDNTENVLAAGTAEKVELKVKYPKQEPEVAYKMVLNIDTTVGLEIDGQTYNTNNLFYSDHATAGEGWRTKDLFWTPLKFRLYKNDGTLLFNGVSLANRNEDEASENSKILLTSLIASTVGSSDVADTNFITEVDAKYDSSYPNWKTDWKTDDLVPNECQSFVLATYINTHPDVVCSKTIYPGSGKVSPSAETVAYLEWVWPYLNMDKDAAGSPLYNVQDYYDTAVLQNTREARKTNNNTAIPRVAIRISGKQQQVD